MPNTPILKIGNILIITIQIDIDDKIALDLQQNILKKISETSARGLVMDISGIDIVDSFLSRIISETALMAKTMGVDTVLVGIRPEIAITLMELGIDLEAIHSALDLERGLNLLHSIMEEEEVKYGKD